MIRIIFCAVLACALASCTGTPQKATSSACDRACLKGHIDQYLAALVSHDPSHLPLSETARFTEDARELPLGSGFWKTATAEGAFMDVAALLTASPAMAVVPPADQRESREAAIGTATRYPAGLRIGSFVTADTPFAPGTYRFENGRRMAGPGCTFRPPSCEDIKGQRIPTLSAITYRVAAVDEELGIVWLRLDFGPGSIGSKDTALHAWEAFKVYGGQIHAVEAFMKVMPAGMPSGWDAPVAQAEAAAAAMVRLTPAEISALAAGNGSGVQMTNLIGDPTKPGLYTVRVAIAAHTQVRPHSHRDNRSVTVMSGTWHMGYGTTFDAAALKDLPPGSVYTEPARQPHFAQTADEPVVIWVTGNGPSDTQFVTP